MVSVDRPPFLRKDEVGNVPPVAFLPRLLGCGAETVSCHGGKRRRGVAQLASYMRKCNISRRSAAIVIYLVQRCLEKARAKERSSRD